MEQGDFPIKYGLTTLKHLWAIPLKTLGHFEIKILKFNWKSNFFTFLTIDQNALKKFSYVIRYTFWSNLLSELVLDPGKCPKKKTCTFTFMHFLVRALPEVKNQFRRQIWLKSIPKLKEIQSVLINKKNVKKNVFFIDFLNCIFEMA